MDNKYDIYHDGSDIVTFRQQTFYTNDCMVFYVSLLKGMIKQYGYNRLYKYTPGTYIHVHISETEDNGTLTRDDHVWRNKVSSTTVHQLV